MDKLQFLVLIFAVLLSILCNVSVRYAEFTPRPVNQAGAQGEEAGRRLANGGAPPLANLLPASSP